MERLRWGLCPKATGGLFVGRWMVAVSPPAVRRKAEGMLGEIELGTFELLQVVELRFGQLTGKIFIEQFFGAAKHFTDRFTRA